MKFITLLVLSTLISCFFHAFVPSTFGEERKRVFSPAHGLAENSEEKDAIKQYFRTLESQGVRLSKDIITQSMSLVILSKERANISPEVATREQIRGTEMFLKELKDVSVPAACLKHFEFVNTYYERLLEAMELNAEMLRRNPSAKFDERFMEYHGAEYSRRLGDINNRANAMIDKINSEYALIVQE